MHRSRPIFKVAPPLVLAGVLLLGAAVTSASGAVAPKPSAKKNLSVAAHVTAAGSYSTNLKGVCPANVIIQTDWYPEVDAGGLYQLIAPSKGVISTSANSYSGPLGTTGVKLTILAGGPAVGYQTVTSQLYANQKILLGQVGTDESIQFSASQPTTAVFASYERNPQIFFWGNPKWKFTSVKQIGASKQTVLAFQATYVTAFEQEGLIKASQFDTSYQGNPARFVAAGGNIISQGFIDDEPYIYAHDVSAWDKPVYELSVQPEYPVYQNALVVRTGALKSDSACLTKLVPILQQAEIDFTKNALPVDKVIYKFAADIKDSAQLPLAGDTWAIKTLLSNKIIGNGPNGVFGSFNAATVQSLITKLKPVFASLHKPIKTNLTTTQIATNEFLDPKIHL
jgi:hypothetical protein